LACILVWVVVGTIVIIGLITSTVTVLLNPWCSWGFRREPPFWQFFADSVKTPILPKLNGDSRIRLPGVCSQVVWIRAVSGPRAKRHASVRARMVSRYVGLASAGGLGPSPAEGGTSETRRAFGVYGLPLPFFIALENLA